MTIQDLGSLGELIAAVATVATLIYLAAQIRQNTSTVRSSSAAAQNQNQNTLLLSLAQDPELNRIFWAGLEARSRLEAAEQRRFDAIMAAMLNNYEQTWRFFNERTIEEGAWLGQLDSIRWFVAQPGFEEYWTKWSNMVSHDFAEVLMDASRSGSGSA